MLAREAGAGRGCGRLAFHRGEPGLLGFLQIGSRCLGEANRNILVFTSGGAAGREGGRGLISWNPEGY